MADTKILPNSEGPVLDRAGIKDTGYIDAKGTPSGNMAKFNKLPPGMNIENQECADIRAQKMSQWQGGSLSYPNDGWT